MTSQAANILKNEWNPYEATWIAASNIQQTLLQVYTQTQRADYRYVLMVVTFNMDQLIVQRYFLQVNQTAFNTPVILLFLILYILFKVTRCACKL